MVSTEKKPLTILLQCVEQLPYGLDLQKDVFVERLAAAKTFLAAQVNVQVVEFYSLLLQILNLNLC